MGILSSLLGNASKIDPKELEREFGPVLFEGEQIESAFTLFRDKWIFTGKRLIMLNVQGMTGSKKEYHTIPYKAITQFSVETAGTFETDSEIKIWVSGMAKPYEKELKKGTDVIGLQKNLAFHTCK